MIRIVLIAALLALAACADTSANFEDPEFKQGYDMGCATAASNAQAREALTAGKSDLYRRGFSAGFRNCGGDREIGK